MGRASEADVRLPRLLGAAHAGAGGANSPLAVYTAQVGFRQACTFISKGWVPLCPILQVSGQSSERSGVCHPAGRQPWDTVGPSLGLLLPSCSVPQSLCWAISAPFPDCFSSSVRGEVSTVPSVLTQCAWLGQPGTTLPVASFILLPSTACGALWDATG